MFWHLRLPITIARNARTVGGRRGEFPPLSCRDSQDEPLRKVRAEIGRSKRPQPQVLTRSLFISLRLKVKAALKTLPPREQLAFTRLKAIVGATDGDLGAPIATLEKFFVEVDIDDIGQCEFPLPRPDKLRSAIVDGPESSQRTIGSVWSSDENALESRLGSCST
jgi:hypothetical protein